MLITCSITNCSTGQKLCIHIQSEVNTNSAHRLLPVTGIKVKHKVTTWSVKSTLFHLGGHQHITSFHLSYCKSCKNALAMFSPELPYQTIEIIWNLLIEACTMHAKALYLISKSNKLHTQGSLTDQYDRKHTLQRSQVQHSVWNTYIWEQPWRLIFSTWESHLSLYIWKTWAR